jgi:hypothetical protein
MILKDFKLDKLFNYISAIAATSPEVDVVAFRFPPTWIDWQCWLYKY